MSELRYQHGNLVIHENDLCISQCGTGNFVLKDDGILYLYKLDNIKPIPLSVNWLKKAGYKQLKRVEKTYSLSSFEDNSAIYFTGVRFIHIITGTHLEYVHELQNLHSAINKQELKFIENATI